MRLLFLIFLIVPILEVWVLLRVGGAIGGLSTIALILLTAVIGVALLRQQSLRTVIRARSKMSRGEPPTGELIEGIFLAIGGALLLTPGFITDAIGFCCLLPGLRQGILGWVLRRSASGSKAQTHQDGPFRDHKAEGSHTIEGEFHREDEPRR